MDVVEAILGEGAGIDTILNELWERIARIYADEESWGLTAEAEAGQRQAEKDFKQARELTPEERAARDKRKAERAARRVADSPP